MQQEDEPDGDKSSTSNTKDATKSNNGASLSANNLAGDDNHAMNYSISEESDISDIELEDSDDQMHLSSSLHRPSST